MTVSFPKQIESTTDTASLEKYGRDWNKEFTPKPSRIVFPKTTQDVVTLVRWARATRTALVPSGGRTGLSAGATAIRGEVVVSFEKMARVLELNPVEMTITAEPGAILETLQERSADAGMIFPLDLGARGSCQLGGNIATNAGGLHVVHLGMLRSWVRDLEVVTGTGEILHLGHRLTKNNSGYDLKELMIGSEGTLGFITQATIQLKRKPAGLETLFASGSDLGKIMEVFSALRRRHELWAFELMPRRALERASHHTGIEAPLGLERAYYFVASVEGLPEAVLEEALSSGALDDATMAQSSEQSRSFWRLREEIPEALGRGVLHKNDIAVRTSLVPELVRALEAMMDRYSGRCEIYWFGHLGDGNIHVNLLKSDATAADTFRGLCAEFDKELFALVRTQGGTISAEHGIGLLKKPFLTYTRSEAEIEVMRGIKRLFDPDGIINPGKVFDQKSNGTRTKSGRPSKVLKQAGRVRSKQKTKTKSKRSRGR